MEPELTWPDAIPAVLAAAGAVVVLAAAWGARRPRGGRRHVAVAHTERLRGLASYRRAVRRRRAGLVVSLVPVLAALVLCGYVVARPVHVESRQSRLDNRDIVLCLDVSGSMSDENLAVVRTFRRLAAEMHGERIGMVVFNTYPMVVFPLTDDYEMVRGQLELAEADLNGASLSTGRSPEFAKGATEAGLGQSLVGDGLMGCVDLFTADATVAALRDRDATETPRSRVVILATDNDQLDSRHAQIFTVSEAAAQASAYDAVVVVLAAEGGSQADLDELTAVATATNGALYPTRAGEEAVEEITRIVKSLDSTVIEGPVVTSRFDVPGRAVGALLAAMGVALVAWRVTRA